MSRSIFLLAILGCSLTWSVAAVARPQLKPGKWQVTTQMDVPGMPMAMPARTITMCFKGSDPKQSIAAATRHGSRGGTCRAEDVKISGNKVSWRLQCSGAHAATGHGEISYFGDHYTGQMVMDVNEQGRAMEMTSDMEGKYLGACN